MQFVIHELHASKHQSWKSSKILLSNALLPNDQTHIRVKKLTAPKEAKK